MKHAFVIRHLAFEDLGGLARVLEEADYRVQYLDASTQTFPEKVLVTADLLIVLGGPISANDGVEYPFLTEEIWILRQRLAHHQPVLGICLGAQLLTLAAGGRVVPAPQKEIGWAPVRLSPAGHDSPLAALDDQHLLHWHGENCLPPDEAVTLASTAACPHQAFSLSRSLGLQFHAEVTASGLERWFVGHALEISQTEGVDVAGLRAQTAVHARQLEECGARMFGDWLQNL
ncbi:MAG: glutamine amidotransferase [Gammaproteobacteria bacterium]|jgi:GMP synthase (glutamine-hydrolysing)|nr:glutamine amidotransferase [Gammaproteobacteria bacterium]